MRPLKNLVKFLLSILSVLSLASCNQDNFIPTTGVFTVGSEGSSLNNNIAKYWRDGNPVVLSDSFKSDNATAIAISNYTIYVSGYERSGVNNIAKYWRNGRVVNLTDNSRHAMEIYVVA